MVGGGGGGGVFLIGSVWLLFFCFCLAPDLSWYILLDSFHLIWAWGVGSASIGRVDEETGGGGGGWGGGGEGKGGGGGGLRVRVRERGVGGCVCGVGRVFGVEHSEEGE